jgi:Ca-activated chloride channel family protein
MTVHIAPMSEAEATRVAAPDEDAGLGALRTEKGNLPLDLIDLRADITGLTSRIELTSEFVNPFDTPLEATYVFPLPDRAAVTGMRMTADDRVIEAELQERGAAREAYDQAIAAGQRASIAEEERPDVFTMRVGNILPGERVSVALTLVGPLSYADGEATFRFPLVVAPRYIPGSALPGGGVGDGYAADTDAVPDASRITPPVLLPGFPNPVRLSIEVGIDPAGLTLGEVRSSLHAVSTQDNRVRIQPGERANRDFVLRLRYGAGSDEAATLVFIPDAEGEEGTYQLTVLPPSGSAPTRPRDVVLVLDRSGSMAGWKMVAARRAAARIVDTLTEHDRFAALTFDDRIDYPDQLGGGLVAGTDRNRYRAVEHLARVDARGGTELLQPLREALRLLVGEGSGGRDLVLVLVTDGQVGNEDQILREITGDLRRVRVHTVGIDQAVNAGFLGRLAAAGGGRCELVESEDRLDDAMDAIHRRIGAPVVTSLSLAASGISLVDGARTPARMPDLFPGVPLVVAGRYHGAPSGSLTLRGETRDGRDWSVTVTGERRDASALTSAWARAYLRDLEDRYASANAWGHGTGSTELEKLILDASLRFGVLCRFTAYVAVDTRVVTEGGQPHRVVQPVEPVAGWDMLHTGAPTMLQASMHVGGAPAPMPMSAPMPFSMPMRAPAPPAGMPFGSSPPLGRTAGNMARKVSEAMRAPKPVAVAAHPELVSAREQAADEVRRLREATGAPGYERRELLADLASRLTALVRHLRGHGLPEAQYSPLAQLAAAIEAGGDVEGLWARALRVLDEYAGNAAKEPERRRGPFWKR